jgi:transposase
VHPTQDHPPLEAEGLHYCDYQEKKGREQLLKPEQVQWLIAPDTLQGMAHLSLERRCMIIKDKWNLPSFSTQTLRMCYRKHGVRYKRPDYTFWKNRAELRDLAGK